MIVRTLVNVEAMRQSVLRWPQRSAHKHAVALRLSNTMVRCILHLDLKFYPYKMATAQKLHAQDRENRVNCCQRIQANVPPTAIVLTSGEAYFHLTGCVNKKNFRYWAGANPHELHERPLHWETVTENRVNCCQRVLANVPPTAILLTSHEAHFHLTGCVNKQNFLYWTGANPHELHERPFHSETVAVWCALGELVFWGLLFRRQGRQCSKHCICSLDWNIRNFPATTADRMSGSFRPPRSPNIIWPSLSSSLIVQ